jgi:pimeloyl-ACP methyl ester carboxylesterase
VLVSIGRGPIDVELTAAAPDAAERPTLVFLHEGLGSIGLWRTFPADVRAALGGAATLVYSRHGYGRSVVVPEARTVDYMHREALDALPALLRQLGVAQPVLVGHSDGASIALIHAGAGHPVAGLVVIAPHVFVEPESIVGIEAARSAFVTTDLRDKLARHHDDVDATFRGWNDIWLSPAFRSWNIEASLPGITAPVLAVQGEADAYGTLAQLDAIEAGVAGPFERLVVPGGHTLHTGDTRALVAHVATFIARL